MLARTRYDAAFRDINVRLHTMDRERIDMQAVSPAPNYAYWADEELSDRIVTASNEHVAEICATNRTGSSGCATSRSSSRSWPRSSS